MRKILKEANVAFRNGKYLKAIDIYRQLQKSRPKLSSLIDFNIALTSDRIAMNQNSNIILQEVNLYDKKIIIDKKDLSGPVNADYFPNGIWKSTNDDPYFSVDLSDQDIMPGYYVLKVNILCEANVSRAMSKLYIDYGVGMSEESAICFLITLNKSNERVVYFTDEVKALRFDPVDVKLDFSISTFGISSLTSQNVYTEIADLLNEKQLTFEDESLNRMYELYDGIYRNEVSSISYDEWIQMKELPSIPSDDQIQKAIITFVTRPLISVVIPTFNTDERYLRECIESVLNQSYKDFELCIADDNSSKSHVLKVLNEYAAKDKRVKVVARKKNGHISRATNSALEVADGDFIAFLDHDDLLASHALYFVVETINANPDSQIIYSDEDKIDLQGRRIDPHFKSDWNPDLFYSQNYVSHLGVYKTSLIKEIGGFRTGVEGSQDQDLLLRCLPHVKSDQIHHIPRVLYHWRMVRGSTALARGEKSYATVAGIKALTDYFVANGPGGVTIEAGLVSHTYKVNWPIPKIAPKVSLLIPTRDRKTITEIAVRSILGKTTYPNYEIVILDNGSAEHETLAFFKQIQQEDNRVRVLRYDKPFNYSAINNFGVKRTDGELVGLINNDIEVINPEWLTEMVSHAIRPDIGCVGAKLYYSNNLIQHAGVVLGIGGVAGHSHKMFPRNNFGYFSRLILVQNLSSVTAAVLIVRRDIYKQVNGLNEHNLKVAFNDVDFCLKVRQAGYRNLWTPYAELYHHESISRGYDVTPERQARFKTEIEYMKKTWKNELTRDPYYNPNLTKDLEDFSIGIG